MYANRISRFLNRVIDTAQVDATTPAAERTVPPGFVPVPANLVQQQEQSSLEALYRMAYEAARSGKRAA